MMESYRKTRESIPSGCLLGIRLGDFIEFFGDDAKAVASLLRITLTSLREIPMAGIPFHAVDSYTAKLIAAGRTVALMNEEKNSLRILSP